MITVDRLRKHIGADTQHDEELQELITQANLLISDYMGTTLLVPEAILDLAVLRVANSLWEQSNVPSSNGNSFYETDQAPAPPNRDPLLAAYPIIRRYVCPW